MNKWVWYNIANEPIEMKIIVSIGILSILIGVFSLFCYAIFCENDIGSKLLIMTGGISILFFVFLILLTRRN